MTDFEIYVFILCFIVFALLTSMFTYLLTSITKMEVELIRFGHRDEAIKKQLNKKKDRVQAFLLVNRIVSLLLCLAFMATFSFALCLQATENRQADGIPSLKVVKSESMSKKHPGNTYLIANKLDNQIQMFDIVVCHSLPAEDELQLYDIVVYERDDVYIIHRIVAIEEPNAQHPNERKFFLQGDALGRPDNLPVRYEQMMGVYRGSRIPFVGSFVLFLQSPAGWLCVLLVVFSMITTPIVEKKIKNETEERLLALTETTSEEEEIE